ncbi:TPA: hypothetical protein G9G20_004908 [Salmonella enterica subsp. enterica serovar Muenchen]|uniref:Uncharacterized protein n=2 Tax=Salmonella enterica I TaxID=59201 RepID=A0A742ICW4_SALMU|nr:hypothetical protein [Salmonella enterica]EDW0309403.1 hypothetical protein [Salmonella enterica subsp. enterica serovar Inverness]EEC1326530.1 hypothetical protein [Salmonella enterica subsp. enterica serovar Muenchen]HAE8090615.1 hypothetical protein [Salmonella enterica subsp. enterica serovar Newport]EBI5345977.1 hypothetical protein [Salmonella enterica]
MHDKLKEAVLSAGTYEDASIATGLSISTIKRLCTDTDKDPRFSHVIALATYASVNLEDILSESNSMVDFSDGIQNDVKFIELATDISGLSLWQRIEGENITYQLTGKEFNVRKIYSFSAFIKSNSIFKRYILVASDAAGNPFFTHSLTPKALQTLKKIVDVKEHCFPAVRFSD